MLSRYLFSHRRCLAEHLNDYLKTENIPCGSSISCGELSALRTLECFVVFFPPSPKETLLHFLRVGMWLGLLWGFWACSSHSPLVFDSMMCSSFNFTVHSSEISLKGNLTQSVLSEVWFVIHFGCCRSVIWLTFLHLHIVKKKNWCGLIKIKGRNVWNPWTFWVHRNFLEHAKA